MAHVIEKEASQIEPKKLNKIQIILNRIYRAIASLFNKDRAWGKELAKQMMQGEFSGETHGLITGSKFESRKPVQPKELSDKLLTDLNEKVKVLSKKVNERGAGKGVLDVYKNVLDRMQEADDVSRFAILNRFITDQLNSLNKRLVSNNKVDGHFLSEAIGFITLYADIDEIVDYHGTEYEDVVEKLKYNSVQINELRKSLLQRSKDYIVQEIGSRSTDPHIKEDMRRISLSYLDGLTLFMKVLSTSNYLISHSRIKSKLLTSSPNS